MASRSGRTRLRSCCLRSLNSLAQTAQRFILYFWNTCSGILVLEVCKNYGYNNKINFSAIAQNSEARIPFRKPLDHSFSAAVYFFRILIFQ